MVVVVGSGASGVHFALSLLRKGREVTMIDAGRVGRDIVAPESTLNDLKESLEDPCAYFLGSRYEAVLLPDDDAEYYGVPPGKQYVFEHLPGFGYTAQGFAPLFSFARGGLAETWTGGCYPLNEDDLRAFPISYSDLEPHYSEVARRIGITGEEDDLARFMPFHDNLLPGLRLDAHSERLLEAYLRRRDVLIQQFGCYMGRTRVATLSRDLGSRKACDYSGRCLWGCPTESLYTPSQTLEECIAHPGFRYVPGFEVRHFRLDSGGRVASVIARPIEGGQEEEFPVGTLVLAAGTLCSSAIMLRSVLLETSERIELRGLMDNRQILMPFLNLRMIGHQFSAESYQYHLLGMAVEADNPDDYVHGQITTLKTALMHPIIQRLPFDLRTSTFLTRSLHGALGLVNVNFRDTRRAENYVTLSDDGETGDPRLAIHYTPSDDEPARMRTAMRKITKALRKLWCVVPPGMAHVRPMGASVHYAGTVPMSLESDPWTTTEYCQSRDFENLYFVDGTSFPFLPAKNLTFTLMANAVRVAETAF
jgi:choline dehydrogenase-like flavoprotein